MSYKIFFFFYSCFFALVWGEDCKDFKIEILSDRIRQNESKVLHLEKEKIIRGKDTIEVEVTMYWKGDELVFHKKGKNFELDSTVYSNGVYFVDETYEIDEAHTLTRSTRSTTPREIRFFIYDNNGKMVQGYSIGMEKTQIYDDKGGLHPIYKEVRGDTVFWDVENFNQWDGSSLFIN
jgi:hypothetical protein